MSDLGSNYVTTRIRQEDARAGYSCGVPPLDGYFNRHALANDASGIGCTYVLRRANDDDESLPPVLGFFTLCMSSEESSSLAPVLGPGLPRYRMPVALIGRLAVDQRARRRGFGERLLVDALCRIVDASGSIGCVGIIVDAKDDNAAAFYEKYDFVTLEDDAPWPRRMFLPIETARAAFKDE